MFLVTPAPDHGNLRLFGAGVGLGGVEARLTLFLLSDGPSPFELDGEMDDGVGGVLLIAAPNRWVEPEVTPFPFCAESGVSKYEIMGRCLL